MAKKDLFRTWMIEIYLESGAWYWVLFLHALCAMRYAVRRKTALSLFRILFPPF